MKQTQALKAEGVNIRIDANDGWIMPTVTDNTTMKLSADRAEHWKKKAYSWRIAAITFAVLFSAQLILDVVAVIALLRPPH